MVSAAELTHLWGQSVKGMLCSLDVWLPARLVSSCAVLGPQLLTSARLLACAEPREQCPSSWCQHCCHLAGVSSLLSPQCVSRLSEIVWSTFCLYPDPRWCFLCESNLYSFLRVSKSMSHLVSVPAPCGSCSGAAQPPCTSAASAATKNRRVFW